MAFFPRSEEKISGVLNADEVSNKVNLTIEHLRMDIRMNLRMDIRIDIRMDIRMDIGALAFL